MRLGHDVEKLGDGLLVRLVGCRLIVAVDGLDLIEVILRSDRALGDVFPAVVIGLAVDQQFPVVRVGGEVGQVSSGLVPVFAKFR